MQKIISNFKDRRENFSVFLAFASLTLFAIRVRGSDFDTPIFFLENFLFCAAVICFPWSIKQFKKGLILFGSLAIYTFITTLTYYNTLNDWHLSLVLYSATTKCFLFTMLVSNFNHRKIFFSLKIIIIPILIYQVGWFFVYGRDVNLGLSTSMLDRNYFALFELFILFSMHLLFKLEENQRKRDLLLINIANILVFLLIVLSGSRTGIIGITFILSIFYGRRAILIILLLLVISKFLGFLEQLEYRFHHEILGGRGNDDVRVAQYVAFINTFYYYPLGIITGFGVMASSHLDWFSQFYKDYDLNRYLYIQHNSILDLIISYGAGGMYLLWKFAKNLNWQILVFALITMSFNNVINFLPFYLFLGVLGSIGFFSKSKFEVIK